MGPLGGSHAPGATPNDPDEVAGLIPKHITTRGELDEWETSNILAGRNWAFNNRYRGDILSEDYVRKLHKQMFGKTWKWAGTFRNTEKSIGVDPARIAVDLHNLLGDVKTQLEFSSYPLDEIATRLHHRLVLIHPFPNGNGRHARLLTEVFLQVNGAAPFTWGQVNLNAASATRSAYIAALQAADARDYAPLLNFVRS
ncbi:mobile mystery protein B [Pseudoduganella sp. R-34]|uniref:mobile mystery protein B n=1 Tax=unclassified Pseudoduganella TaxID=2637179 RepID=UPI003CF30366